MVGQQKWLNSMRSSSVVATVNVSKHFLSCVQIILKYHSTSTFLLFASNLVL